MPNKISQHCSPLERLKYVILAFLLAQLIPIAALAGLQGGGSFNLDLTIPTNLFPPSKKWNTASEIVIRPGPGEIIEILYIDEGAGVKYYRAIGAGYERGGKANVHGDDYNIVPPVNKVHFSNEKKRFYWSTEQTIETILITEDDHKILAQSAGYEPNASKWIWMNRDTFWFWDNETQTWNYLLGNVVLFNKTTEKWNNLYDSDLYGWIWMDDLPWIYSTVKDTWYYVVGDLWTFSNSIQQWQRVENKDAMQIPGTFGTSYYEEETDNLYFQLNPPADSQTTIGSIQKLSLPSMVLSTAVELTNATHITSFPSKAELYWSETRGVYANMSGSFVKRPLMLTTPLGEPVQPIYKEPSPSILGSRYNLDIRPDDLDKSFMTIDFMTANEFRMGYGNIFISGIYTWIKTGTHTASARLISQSLILSPTGLQANNVAEAFTLSGGTVNLPKEITLQITYRDTTTAKAQIQELLADNSTINHPGDVKATGGFYLGTPTYDNLLNEQGASVTKLSPRESENQLFVDLMDEIGLQLPTVILEP